MLIIIKLQDQNYTHMMKKIYTLLSIFTLLAVANVSAQTLYTNTTQTGSRFNPGLGLGGTPIIAFDDINIPSATIGDADSIGFTKIKVGIRRLANAAAITVNVYLSEFDPTSFGLDSLPKIPPTLIGTFNLPANGAAAQTQILSVGDSINVFKSILRDTGNLFTGLQTAFVGVSFSTADGNQGWRLTSGPGPNFDGAWFYDVDSETPRTVFGFGASAVATFYVEAFGRPIYAPIAYDAKISDITTPDKISCYNSAQTFTVDLLNLGDNPILPGAAAVTLKIGGANTYTGTLFNTGTIAKNATETITFSNVGISGAGVNFDTAFVVFASDLKHNNDTLTTGNLTAETITAFPAVEDVETTLPVFGYLERIAGTRNLWGTNPGYPFAYGNPDLADSLFAHGGQDFFLFDAYSGANSTGVQTRLYSNCMTLTHSDDGGVNNMTFWMSHDTSFSDSPDSLYVSVSLDKGITWNRIAGFARLDPAFVFPDWSQETVDLTAYGCQTIQLAFEGVSYYGNVIGVDDISINSFGTGSCTTPLTLLNFTAQKVNKVNKLTWTTTQELNTLKFVIEQSKDGRTFTQLGEVAASGNTSTERTYTYSHNQPSKGYNYYRIKMVDNDNRFTYSPVRSLQNLGINEISSYPNPVKGMMQVAVNADKSDVATIQITDMSGKTVYTKVYNVAEGENNFSIDAAAFTSGNYILKVQLSGEVVVKKFSKL